MRSRESCLLYQTQACVCTGQDCGMPYRSAALGHAMPREVLPKEVCMKCGSLVRPGDRHGCAEVPKFPPPQVMTGVTVKDPVTLPGHYARYKIEPIRFITENKLDFFQGNIVKYVTRHDAKNGVEDLKKSRRYLDMYIEFLQGNPDFWKQAPAKTEKPKALKVTRSEGGDYEPFVPHKHTHPAPHGNLVHSVHFEDGSVWDAWNGWRK